MKTSWNAENMDERRAVDKARELQRKTAVGWTWWQANTKIRFLPVIPTGPKAESVNDEALVAKVQEAMADLNWMRGKSALKLSEELDVPLKELVPVLTWMIRELHWPFDIARSDKAVGLRGQKGRVRCQEPQTST